MSAIRPLSPDSQRVTQDALEDLFEDAVTLSTIRCAETLACGHTFSASTIASLREKICSICRAPFSPEDVFKDEKVDGYTRAFVQTSSSTDDSSLVSMQKFKLLQKPNPTHLSFTNIESNGKILEVHIIKSFNDTFEVHILVNPAHAFEVTEQVKELENKNVFFNRDIDRTRRRPGLEEFQLSNVDSVPYSTAIINEECTFDEKPFIRHAVRCLFLLRPRPAEPRLFQLRSSRLDQVYLVTKVNSDTFYEHIFRSNNLSKSGSKALKTFMPPKDLRSKKKFLGCDVCKKTHLLKNPHIVAGCGHVADPECLTTVRILERDLHKCKRKTCKHRAPSDLKPYVLYAKALEALKPKEPIQVSCGSNHKHANKRAKLRSSTPDVEASSFQRDVSFVDTTNFMSLCDTPSPSRFGRRFTRNPYDLSMITFSSFEASSYIRQIHVFSDLRKHYVMTVRLQESNFTKTLYDLRRQDVYFQHSRNLSRNYIIFTHHNHDSTRKFFALVEDHLDLTEDKKHMLREYACIDYEEGRLSKLFKRLCL